MKVPKTDALEQIIDKINTELDIDRRTFEQSDQEKNFVNSFGVNHMKLGT